MNSSTGLVVHGDHFDYDMPMVVAGFLAGYPENTLTAYQQTGIGGKTALIPMAPGTARTVCLAVGDREDGPIFLNSDGDRMDRHQAVRIVRRLAKRAGIDKNIRLPTSQLHNCSRSTHVDTETVGGLV